MKVSLHRDSTRNTGSVLHSQLYAEAIQDLDPWQIAALRPGSLFTVFLGDLTPYKGALVSGFSQRGGRLKTKVEFDFGDLLAPGAKFAGFQATAAANVQAQAEHSAYMMMVLSRMPRSLAGLDFAEPWTLACMTGYLVGWRIAVGAEAGIKIGAEGIEGDKVDGPPGLQRQESPSSSESLWEDAAAKCEAKAVLEAEVSYEGQRLKIRDSAPLAYSNNGDAELAREFEQLLGPGDKHTVKRHALSIFEDSGLTDEMKAAKPERNWFRRKFRSEHMSSFAEIEEGFNKLVDAIDACDWPQTQKDRYLARVEFHRKNIETYRTFDIEAITKERDSTRRAALMARGGEDQNTREGFQYVTSKFCFIDLWGHKPGAKATAKAEGALQLAGQGMTAGASAGVEGGVKWTLYRYQTYVSQYSKRRAAGPGQGFMNVVAEASRAKGLDAFKNLKLSRDMIVMTQDTRITYKQVTFSASAQAEFKSVLGGVDGEKGGTKSYGAMSYRSAVVYWKVPYARDVSASMTMPAEEGSGLCIGHSYPTEKLYAAAESQSQEYAETIGRDLSVEPDCVLTFLAQCKRKLPALFEKYPAVLVEAAFPVPSGYRFPVEETTKAQWKWHQPKSGSIHGFKGQMAQDLGLDSVLIGSGPVRTPQVLRLRVRQADSTDNTKSKFKLGFKAVVGVEIELESVENAGREAIVDLHNTFFDGDGAFSMGADRATLGRMMMQGARGGLKKGGRNQSPIDKFRAAGKGMMSGARRMTQNFEGAVPPVALLHQ